MLSFNDGARLNKSKGVELESETKYKILASPGDMEIYCQKMWAAGPES
jgi:hypothetical protein